jgi:Cys-rich repeat protein
LVCTAKVGYDGPTGVGTPNGVAIAGNRPCTAADNGGLCNGATPVCETDAANSKFGKCVACVASTDCKGLKTPFCDRTTDTCRGCTKDAECSGATPHCQVSSGQCGECVVNADCTAAKPICNTVALTCRGCSDDTECPAGQKCDPGTRTCSAPSGSSGSSGASGTSGASGSSGGTSGSSGSSGGTSGGVDGGAGNNATDDGTSSSSGCALSGDRSGSTGVAAFGVLFGLFAIARRRRR